MPYAKRQITLQLIMQIISSPETLAAGEIIIFSLALSILSK